jgi:hypothetical protein
MGTLSSGKLACFEEHLLICPKCQDRLEEMDLYTRAMWGAARAQGRLETTGSGPWRMAKPIFAAPAILGVLLLGWIRWQFHSVGGGHEICVLLETHRGPDYAKAPPGKPLLLQLDPTDLPNSPVFRLEVVNARGSTVWQSSAKWPTGKISVRIDRGLARGVYFVRICDPPHELLREYGLRID